MNLKTVCCLAVSAAALSACVSHVWAPGPGATMPFSQASGQCKLAALSGNEGFFAVGSASYVAGAAIGNGIGNAVRQNRIYNACMEAAGFVAVDTQQTATANSAMLPIGTTTTASSSCLPGQSCGCGGGPNSPTVCRPE